MPFHTIVFDDLDSTMYEADRRVAAGETGPFVIVARSQSGGHGRHGRTWSSPQGNLYWTAAVPRQAPWPRDYGLTFACGLAMIGLLEEVGVALSRIHLKWPNDPLVDGRKISGILVRETQDRLLEGSTSYCLAGIGLNLVSFPEDAYYLATSLAHVGVEGVSVDAAYPILNRHFEEWLSVWRRGTIAALIDAYRDRMYGIGTIVRVATNYDRTKFVEGLCLGVDAIGTMQLELTDGTVRIITAGDVLLPIQGS